MQEVTRSMREECIEELNRFIAQKRDEIRNAEAALEYHRELLGVTLDDTMTWSDVCYEVLKAYKKPASVAHIYGELRLYEYRSYLQRRTAINSLRISLDRDHRFQRVEGVDGPIKYKLSTYHIGPSAEHQFFHNQFSEE